MEIILATKNRGKIREILDAFVGLDYHFGSLFEYPDIPEIEETGSSYQENALIKARAATEATGKMALADDSGLEVETLGWEPGIHSARYVSNNASDCIRNEKVLTLLKELPREKRQARFCCSIAITMRDGKAYFAHGQCYGYISERARGGNGFGYDPIFCLPEFGRTFGELEGAIKNRVSHRAKALAQARRILEDLRVYRDADERG
ncbi:MAG: RdgB/HAM1 family non-canonical purine NTP pyrophosphatase [Candidatus Tectomicrobia bacterium]|uniref:dITP/XTP pyrophosphatase n=1 Tax=Tectimicrobiota bacterium TaxID=2528274 RepID=A0A933GNU4_UNCTE|nr:RdgB/HAM1 family non-canonical purine NTP pyrophosphatase [Candidatus Tectomicrobia bacterium]